jgi:hypothetical protein
MKTKSNALAVFAREKYDSTFELVYHGKSKQYAQRRVRELKAEGARVAGCEVRCNAQGRITMTALK